MIKTFLKKSRTVVACYENIGMLRSYFVAKTNYVRGRKSLSKEDKLRIKQYKDIHKGKRCFIVATGPSQTIHDLELMKNEITFTVNTGYKVYPQTKWRADYYVLLDDNATGFLEEAINDEVTYKGIFGSALVKPCKGKEKVIRLAADASSVFLFNTVWNRLFPHIFPLAKFSKDISKKIYAGKTVVYSCIQIAAYMGFDEIYLTGVDCDYDKKVTHAETMSYELSEAEKKQVIKSGKLMRIQFEALAKILPKYGVKVYNATRGGALEAFPRVDLDDVLMN